jgi:hypothetical protein
MAVSMVKSVFQSWFPSSPPQEDIELKESPNFQNKRSERESKRSDSLIPLSLTTPSVELPESSTGKLLVHINSIYARTGDIDATYPSKSEQRQEPAFLTCRERLEELIKTFRVVATSSVPKKTKKLFEEAIQGLEECLKLSIKDGLAPELVNKVEQWRLSWPEKSAPKVGKSTEEGIAFWLRTSHYRKHHHSWDTIDRISSEYDYACNIRLRSENFISELRNFFRISRIMSMKKRLTDERPTGFPLYGEVNDQEILLSSATMQIQSYGEDCKGHWRGEYYCSDSIFEAVPKHIKLPEVSRLSSMRWKLRELRNVISHEFSSVFKLEEAEECRGTDMIWEGLGYIEEIHDYWEDYFGSLLPIVPYLAAIELMRSWAWERKIEPSIDFPLLPLETTEPTASVSHTFGDNETYTNGREFDKENQPGLQWFLGDDGPKLSLRHMTNWTEPEDPWAASLYPNGEDEESDAVEEGKIEFRGCDNDPDPFYQSWTAGEMHESIPSAKGGNGGAETSLKKWEEEYAAIEWTAADQNDWPHDSIRLSGHFELDGFYEGLIKGYICFNHASMPIKFSGRIELGQTFAYVNGSATLSLISSPSQKWRDNHPCLYRKLPRPPPWYIASFQEPDTYSWLRVPKGDWDIESDYSRGYYEEESGSIIGNKEKEREPADSIESLPLDSPEVERGSLDSL